ncbi:MAG: PAS domain-containing protein [Mangrovicoccus sp.]|nr:PAS domain-containing protein [Mangrovicoccus sp.]
MPHSSLSMIDAYWEGLRAGRLVPRRSDVDPRGIDRALEHAFILERIAPGMARFRLAGMHLNDLMGMEVRGMPLTSFFSPQERRDVSELLEYVFEEPAKVRLRLTAERSIGKPSLEAELLLLPLKSDLGDISRVLGCFVASGEIGRTPRRFRVAETQKTPLLLPAPEAAPQADPSPKPDLNIAPSHKPGEGFAERPTVFRKAADPAPGAPDPKDPAKPLRGERPYLKLVRNED